MRVALFALVLAACSEPPAEPPFVLVHERLPAGLFSVHGTSARDVWAVGGADEGGAGAPFVLHFDGDGWTRLNPGVRGVALWWVHAFGDGTVFLAGEGGTVLRYADGVFTAMATPAVNTVFGLWGARPDDVWAVGGAGGRNGFVWRFDGASWTSVPLPAGHPDAAVFKVWGRAADDVWFCGLEGTLLHWDGAALTPVESGTTRSLFTVHAVEGAVVAVGGAGSGTLLERGADGGFVDVTPPLTPQLNGVWLTSADEGYAVGLGGSVVRRVGGVFREEDPGVFVPRDLHAVWVDPDGGVWAVGGQILVPPFTDGVVIHRGASVPGGTYAE